MNTNTVENKRLRTVRSFVTRKGRMTRAQSSSLQELWLEYGISCKPDELVDLEAIFQRKAPTVLEIGFGNGKTLLHMARQHPTMNFIGIEVYQSGITQLLADIHKESLTNIRIFMGDAVEILRNNIPNSSLNILQLFFPDPWPKARHHKRRIIQPNFVSLVSDKLLAKGVLHVATDWENYAMHILEVMYNQHEFIKLDNAISYGQILERIVTKFEQRGCQLGYKIYDFAFRRI